MGDFLVSTFSVSITLLFTGEGWQDHFDSERVECCSKYGEKAHVDPHHLYTSAYMELASGYNKG